MSQGGASVSGEGPSVYMIIDPETREAIRLGDDAKASGPLFFTSRERLAEWADEEGVEEYEVYEVPGGVLTRMKGKPHWVDGEER
jgi:hypothetical protein